MAALALVLFSGAGAGLVLEGGRLRAIELVIAAASVAVAAAAGWPVSGHTAFAAAAAVLAIETLDGKLDAAHAPLRVLVAAAIAGAALLAGRLQRPRRLRAAEAVRASGRRLAPGTLAHELERAKRTGRPLSLVIVRPDELDVLAQAGAETLARLLDTIGEAIDGAVRTIDAVERDVEQGFSLVLSDADSVAARTVAERLRLQIDAARPERAPGRPLGLTVSIGIASYPVDGERVEALEAAAQRALVHATQLGGNRTVLHSVPPGAPRGWGLSPAGSAARRAMSPPPRG